jgi:hypothetical protein
MAKAKKQLSEDLTPMVSKYFDLVQYGKTNQESVKKIIEERYPKDIDLLQKNPDWQDGFNSGMLLALQYVMTVHYDGIESAKAEFPNI